MRPDHVERDCVPRRLIHLVRHWLRPVFRWRLHRHVHLSGRMLPGCYGAPYGTGAQPGRFDHPDEDALHRQPRWGEFNGEQLPEPAPLLAPLTRSQPHADHFHPPAACLTATQRKRTHGCVGRTSTSRHDIVASPAPHPCAPRTGRRRVTLQTLKQILTEWTSYLVP